MEHVRDAALARGCGAGAVAEDVRAVLLARHPALPLAMIDGAVAAMLGESEGNAAPPRPRAVRRVGRRVGFGKVHREWPR